MTGVRTNAVLCAAVAICLLPGSFVQGQTPAQLPDTSEQNALTPTTTPSAPAGVTGLGESPLALTGTSSNGTKEDGAIPGPAVFGILGLRGYFLGDHVASNGVEFNQIFSLDLNFNIWLLRQKRVYLFLNSRFWGQKAAPGITNPSQGAFDFSKREFDLIPGVAWNYYGRLEARVFAYSYNNLNRGTSTVAPSGFADGVGLENRYYIGQTYDDLGTAAFDKARATFVSVGYYPTKSLVDGTGNEFKPGPFVRAYLTLDLWGERCYLFTDDQFIAARSGTPRLFLTDSGIAVRPVAQLPRLEFRLGSEDAFDLNGGPDMEYSGYVSIRYIY